MYKAYLEDYQNIKILLKNNIECDVNNVFICEPQIIKMDLCSKSLINSYWHLEYKVSTVLKTHVDYYIFINDDIQVHLDLGKITRSPLFEVKNFTNEQLGFVYNKESTEFRLWAPVAKEVILVLPNLKVEYHLNYYKEGIWKFRVYGNLDKEPYYYMVRINQKLVNILDPYAISSSTNSEYNYVIDLDKTYQQKYVRPNFSGKLTDSIIAEMHLKDFGYMLPGNNSYYIKACESFDKVGLNYLKDLGVSHVQILPLNAFAGVDEASPDKFYNWGYNPVEYFSITNWYSANPTDPYASINELKEMVDVYHKNGLLVNLDVVFNHVYDYKTFSLNQLVPGYVFRTNNIDFMTNGSGCGNDLATERLMIRRLIKDALIYYTKTFGFDGYRFDLMGLIDIETMKEVETSLQALNPNIILYGEGWEMQTGLDKKLLAFNRQQLPTIGYFNDYFRNVVKGNPFNLAKGLITGGKIDHHNLKNIVAGSNNPYQAINFIECHDNYTVYDQMTLTTPKIDDNTRKDFLKLGLQMLMISQGIPFIHLGMEFGRTKKGHDNSYNLPIQINKIEWQKINEYQEVIESLKDIIQLRKDIPLFRLETKEQVSNHLVFLEDENNYFNYYLSDKLDKYYIFITNNYESHSININGTLIFDGRKTLKEIETLVVNKPGVYIIKQ